MEHTGFEPVASTMPLWRAPSCANAPWPDYNTKSMRISRESERKYDRKEKKGSDRPVWHGCDRLFVYDLVFFIPKWDNIPGLERWVFRKTAAAAGIVGAGWTK